MGLFISSIVSAFESFGKRDCKLLMLGLDAAGKTTTLYKLKIGESVMTTPTIGFNVESLEYKKLRITAWDVGGQTKLRKLWKHYYQDATALMFIVDSADKARLSLAAEELHAVMQNLRGAPCLVFANKQDLPGAASALEVSKALALDKLPTKHWWVQGCCASSGDGLFEGLDWLNEAVDKAATE